MRKGKLEKLQELRRQRGELLQTDLLGLIKLLVDGNRPEALREVNPTQLEFILSDGKFDAYMGRAGAAKTTTGCARIWTRLLFEPGCKVLVSRLDYNDMLDTTYRVMDAMLQRLPPGTLIERNKTPPEKWWIQPAGYGEPSQVTFMGLKEAVGSYEFNHVFIDEADEVDIKRIEELVGRLRYLRPGVPEEENNYSIALAFNPPPKTHPLYTACTGRDAKDRVAVETPWFRLYTPKAGENLRNLPPGYYETMMKGMSADLRQRLIEGQWVEVFPGAPVYQQFKREWHVKESLPYSRGLILERFWDFGYRAPYCGFAQTDHFGAKRVLFEVVGENEEATAFIRRVKAEGAKRFPGHNEWLDYGDPAAAQKKDTGSTLAVLNTEGIILRYVKSLIEEGIRRGRAELERAINGEPAMQFERHGCPMLISALSGGYHMDEKGEKPVKDGYYDHSADAWRYWLVNTLGVGGMVRTATALPGTLPTSLAVWDNRR